MSLSIYEKINEEKLLQVLQCNNLPIKGDGDHASKLKAMLTYFCKPITENGRQVRYFQKGLGRLYGNGLQSFQKDIRSYVCDGQFIDFDMKSGQMSILNNLFIEQGKDIENYQVPKYVTEYLEDRDACLLKHNMTKEKTLMLVNDENYFGKNDPIVSAFHDALYFGRSSFVSWLVEKFPDIMEQVKEKNVSLKKKQANEELTNKKGQFIALVYQFIENKIIQVAKDFMISLGLDVSVLTFDGVMIRKNEISIPDDLFERLEEEIFAKTKYRVQFAEKPLTTDWVPIAGLPNIMSVADFKIDAEGGERFNEDMARSFLDDKKNLPKENERDFIDYMNKFLCAIDKPVCFGWKDAVGLEYEFSKSKDICDLVPPHVFKLWRESSLREKYLGFHFSVNRQLYRMYNLYRRPEEEEYAGFTGNDHDEIFNRCPLFFDYLYRGIADGDTNVYKYTIEHISRILQKGKTGICFVLMGEKGTGKSTLGRLLSILVGDQYSIVRDSVDEMMNSFNSILETTIICTLEEVGSNVGAFSSFQEKLKNLVENPKIMITRKGFEGSMKPNATNYFLCTNGQFPVTITNDNRRYLAVELSKTFQNDFDFFGNLKKEVEQNAKFLRYFFQQRVITMLAIPKTSQSKDLEGLTTTPLQRYVEEELEEVLTDNTEVDKVYQNYRLFVVRLGVVQDPLDKHRFFSGLKKLGYSKTANNERRRVNGKLVSYVFKTEISLFENVVR